MRLLFEIGMEELPARFLKQTLKNLSKNLEQKLKSERIDFSEIKTYGTPRRLILDVDGISQTQKDLDETNLGPAKKVAYDENGELSRAGLGFIRSQGVDPSQVKIVDTPKGEYIAVKKFVKGKTTIDIMPEILKNLVLEIEFPKSMKWADKKLKFARPVQWFLAILDDKTIEFEIEGIKSSNKSRGHRFFGQDFEVSSPEDYFTKIKENNVIIDPEERRQMILTQIRENCETEDEQVLVSPDLLDEVSNLIEYPYAMVGTFNQDFLEVPQEVLIISMEVHQRYFPILDKNGKLLPKFVVIRNGVEGSEFVRRGNEKVLSARLADARFFYQEDLKAPLENNIESLKSVVYQKDLGTIYEKLTRMEVVAKKILDAMDKKDKTDDIVKTLYLSKADLTSNMVGEKEFTKLQGFMGANYALKNGEKESVARGIEEHYYPRYQGDKLPKVLEGIVVGLADRTDTLVGCFSVGLIPSGSKDPFALRRSALGIINIILDAGINISLGELVNTSLDTLESVSKSSREKVYSEVMEFLKQRAINVFSDMGYRKDIIYAVLDKDYDNISKAHTKIKDLEKFIKESEFDKLIPIIKRVGNITKEHKSIEVDTALFKEPIESKLYSFTVELEHKTNDEIEREYYIGYLHTISAHYDVINSYFDEVKVMDDDLKIRNNRLSSLKYLSKVFTKMAYLDEIDEK